MEYSAPSARAKLDMNHPKLWWVMCLCYVQRVAFFLVCMPGRLGKGCCRNARNGRTISCGCVTIPLRRFDVL